MTRRRYARSGTTCAILRVVERSVGFGPIATRQARVLILGSLPGVRSLADSEYYAQPQNAFWNIMGALIGAGPQLAYAARLERLTRYRIALWDVIRSAVRAGSMDSAIERNTIRANDFVTFLSAHPRIELVCFNGKTAASLWRRMVVPTLPPEHAAIGTQVLPSTSPAYASMRVDRKLERWRAALEPLDLGFAPRRERCARDSS